MTIHAFGADVKVCPEGVRAHGTPDEGHGKRVPDRGTNPLGEPGESGDEGGPGEGPKDPDPADPANPRH